LISHAAEPSNHFNAICDGFIERLHLLLIVAAALVLVSCSSSKFPSGELIMFTALGPHAFEGRVLVVRPDGSRVTPVLNPRTSLGYESAYGNSLKTFVLVSADQSTGANSDAVNIAQYTPRTGKLVPLQQQLPSGQEGVGIPSPDDSMFLAEIGPVGQPQTNLWISDFKTKQFRQLTQGPAQDSNEAWSPDGLQIAFIRLLPPFPSVTTQLMTVPSQGGAPTTLLGTSEGAAEAAYSPDGKKLALISINGMETLDLTTMQRSVIVPFNTLYGSPIQRATEGRGMSWAKNQDKIVLIMLDLATNRDQLWTVSSNGNSLQKIYTADAGAFILSVTFVEN
jgi:Tol biopolymer transport system component